MSYKKHNYNHIEFRSHLLSGNYDICLMYVNELIKKGIDFKLIFDEIIKKSLYDIGELWESSKITVATEHRASAIVEMIMSEVHFYAITQKQINKSVVVACPEEEYHRIGIEMVNDVFEINGWRIHFLGVNTSIDSIIKTIDSEKPDLVALSLSLPFNLPMLEKMINKINLLYPQMYLLVGGQAFQHTGFDLIKNCKNVIYKRDLTTLDEFLKLKYAEKN